LLVAEAKYNYYPEELIIEKPKSKTYKNVKVRKTNKLMYFFMVITLLISSLFILFRYVKITETRLQITRLEKEIVELQKLKVDLEADLEGLKATTKITEEASINLGMIYPNVDQIVYVSVDPKQDIQMSHNNFKDKVKGIFSFFSSVL